MACDPIVIAASPLACAAVDAAGAAGSSAVDRAIDGFANSAGKVAGGMLRWLAEQLSTATGVDLSVLTPSGSPSILTITWAIALVMCVMLLVIQVGLAALTRNPKGIWIALRGVAIAFPGAMVVLMALPTLLAMLDAMSSGVMNWSVTNQGTRVLNDMASTLSADPTGLGAALLEIVLIVSSAMVYVALLLRMLLILVAAVMAPLAFAGAVAEWSSKWPRRWVEITLALAVSKLLLVIVFATGFAVIYGVNKATVGLQTPAQVSNVAAGALLLLCAGFAPMGALKLFHFAGDSLGQIHAMHQAAASGGQKVVDTGKEVAKKAISAATGVPVSSGKNPPAPSGTPVKTPPETPGDAASPTTTPESAPGGGSSSAPVPVSSGSGSVGGSSDGGSSADTSGSDGSSSSVPVSSGPAELPAKESV